MGSRNQNQWGNIRILASIVSEIKEVVKENDRYGSVSDFTAYACRKELDRMAGLR